jgi:prevent-host-death family protein
MAAIDVAASLDLMTLHDHETEVGVRELHDRLSEYLEKVEEGVELVVTRRGRPVARITPLEGERPFEELVRRGLIRLPERPKRKAVKARVKAKGSVSDLVKEQRR